MNASFIPNGYQPNDPFVLALGVGQAVTLAAAAAPRGLAVHEGRVWLTRQCRAGTPDDIWLEAGQTQVLPAGSEWVAEAWPRASLSVSQSAQAVVKARVRPSWASWA